MTDPSDDLRAAARVLAAGAAPADDILAALGRLPGLRRELDRLERGLIEAAREHRASWARIASALELASRQAAEQRWLRLSGAEARDPVRARRARARQQEVDGSHGPAIVALRAAAVTAHRRMSADPAWDGRHPRAALARRSLGEALAAPPGALYELAKCAVNDLAGAHLPRAAATALQRLREALHAAG